MQDHHRLPPSPPPSPPRRRPRKKQADPFLELGNTSFPSESPPPSPQPVPDAPHESPITRIILTPVLFTSFLVSLFLIDRSDRARRSQSRDRSHHQHASLLSYIYPSSWVGPEPYQAYQAFQAYQDPNDTTWDRRGMSAHVKPHDAISPKHAVPKNKRSWHLHSNIRKMARLEITDALEMRHWVIAVMVSAVALLLVGLWWAVRWVLSGYGDDDVRPGGCTLP